MLAFSYAGAIRESRMPEEKKPTRGRPSEKKTEFSKWAADKGYTAKSLAAALGVSIPTVKRLLAESSRPSLELAGKIAVLSKEGDTVKFPPEYWLSKVPKTQSKKN